MGEAENELRDVPRRIAGARPYHSGWRRFARPPYVDAHGRPPERDSLGG